MVGQHVHQSPLCFELVLYENQSENKSLSVLLILTLDEFSDILFFILFFSIDILLHIHLSNIKTLSLGTNIMKVPGKNIKRNS